MRRRRASSAASTSGSPRSQPSESTTTNAPRPIRRPCSRFRVASEAPPKPAAADPYLGKNLRGVARLAEGLDPISDEDVNWGIFKRAGDEKGEHVNTFYGAPFADNIAPGDYIVEVTYRQLKREFPLKVEKGKPAALDVILDAGYVTSEGAATE